MHAPSPPRPPWTQRRELGALLRIALPLVAVRAGHVMMGVVDTVMAGQLSSDAVAALALASTSFFLTMIFGMGALMGVEPEVAQGAGAQTPARWRDALNAARALALLLALPLSALCLLAPWALAAMGQPPALLGDATAYLWMVAPGLLPALLFHAHASYLSAHGETGPFLRITLIANACNVVGNLVFIRGLWGLPALGVAGIGLSTTLCGVVELLSVLWYLRRGGRLGALHVRWRAPERAALATVWRLGMPVGTQYTLEVAGFSVATALMGLKGSVELAAHQVALSLSSLAFTVALGWSGAAASRVGQALGRGEPDAAQRAAHVAWLVGGACAALFAVLMWTQGARLASLYVDAPETVALAASFLMIAGVFQLADTTQAIGFGVLRGLGDTRVPALFNIVAYWGLGLPLGYAWAFEVGDDPRGIWWGLTLALCVVAVLLVGRFRRLMRAYA